MPGCFKQTLFAFIAVLSFASFILILVAMGSPKWMTGKILCKTGAELVNATDPELIKFMGEIYYGLFGGGKMRQCGLGGRRSKFRIFPHLVKKLNTTLHVAIILFLCVAFSFALVSLGFCVLNIMQVPYRAITGPAGIALWNFLAGPSYANNRAGGKPVPGLCYLLPIAGGFVVLAATSFMAAVNLHNLTERIANFRENIFRFVVLEEQYEYCYWLCVASAVIHCVNMLLVAISLIRFPSRKTKTEEANVTPEDIMY